MLIKLPSQRVRNDVSLITRVRQTLKDIITNLSEHPDYLFSDEDAELEF